jgi:transcription antitermination factor NusG
MLWRGSRAPARGPLYRALAPLQRAYFDPPDDRRAAWDIEQEPRVSKLTSAPAIEHGRDLRSRPVAFWAVSRLAPKHEALALHCLTLAGFTTYLPRLCERRVSRGRKVEITPPLFPGYCFTLIELQWHAARWTPGTLGLIMDGTQPAHVPDRVIDEIRARVRGSAQRGRPA